MESIKYFRKSKGWTQEQLANMVGVKRSVISKYESDIVSPSYDMIKKIAAALNVPIAALVGTVDEIDTEITKDLVEAKKKIEESKTASSDWEKRIKNYEGEDMGNKRIFDITYHLAEGQKIGETFCSETEPPVLGLAEHFAGTAGYIVIQWDSGRFTRFINKEAIQYIDVSGPQE